MVILLHRTFLNKLFNSLYIQNFTKATTILQGLGAGTVQAPRPNTGSKKQNNTFCFLDPAYWAQCYLRISSKLTLQKSFFAKNGNFRFTVFEVDIVDNWTIISYPAGHIWQRWIPSTTCSSVPVSRPVTSNMFIKWYIHYKDYFYLKHPHKHHRKSRLVVLRPSTFRPSAAVPFSSLSSVKLPHTNTMRFTKKIRPLKTLSNLF